MCVCVCVCICLSAGEKALAMAVSSDGKRPRKWRGFNGSVRTLAEQPAPRRAAVTASGMVHMAPAKAAPFAAPLHAVLAALLLDALQAQCQKRPSTVSKET